MNITAIRPKKIAVIGSGISGLSCAWLLNKAHQVTLYEKDDRLGGHSNTVSFDLVGTSVDVDTGFIVFNPQNYPNLVKFFEHIDVATCPTDMSFAVSINAGQLEYNGSGLAGLFAQPRNIISPTFWSMIKDLMRFYRQADALMLDPSLADISLGELLNRHGYGERFIYDHLLPMGAAIWSTPVKQMLDYPALSFLRFCKNHGLLQLKDRPQWHTIPGGSISYVNKIASALTGNIRLNSRIHKVIRQPNGVIIEDLHGAQERYDDVVLACHADQALTLLANPTEAEQRLLSHFSYQRNQAFLHLDQSLLPNDPKVWSSWNYMATGSGRDDRQVSISYWMNRLQPLATEQPIVVSLNPLKAPAADKMIRSFFYDHPAFDRDSFVSQQKLWSLQGQQNTWFCGAWFGYGFHEDGIQSGLAVAEQLGGIPRPWQLENPNSRITVTSTIANTEPKERAHG
ncbi:FAD-dependent oxidoreductase [Amphritea sp. 1_MG-2023]|uniref:NAD(P)/FAD-dependent oxidoreductase n=1 Tax=Amphritea sp. 1_MG-2023 TaxID=3062670 RepID=UPI0026E38760|nr:FAD-dependent oxidoreductase [Amphritea sp. 1_MG-2023]MDO6563342.1 FAD-dependent oxidoreductase [Amphritea sp. 1_MG-2023]